MAWGLGVALLFLLFGNHIGELFADDPSAIAYASLYLAIVPFSYGTWGVLMMASATFNSLGKPIASTLMSVIRMFVIYVPLAYVGSYYFDVTSIFAAACISNLVMGAVGYGWNRLTYGSSYGETYGKKTLLANGQNEKT